MGMSWPTLALSNSSRLLTTGTAMLEPPNSVITADVIATTLPSRSKTRPPLPPDIVIRHELVHESVVGASQKGRDPGRVSQNDDLVAG